MMIQAVYQQYGRCRNGQDMYLVLPDNNLAVGASSDHQGGVKGVDGEGQQRCGEGEDSLRLESVLQVPEHKGVLRAPVPGLAKLSGLCAAHCQRRLKREAWFPCLAHARTFDHPVAVKPPKCKHSGGPQPGSEL
jgi:hypothetical protein